MTKKINIIYLKKIITDEDIKAKEGEYYSNKFYKNFGKDIYYGDKQQKLIITEDTDAYEIFPKNNKWLIKKKPLFKFRKKVINKKLTNNALESFLKASKKKHENRGAAAGVLDRNKLANYIGKFVNKGKFRTKFISSYSGKESKQATSNLSMSNIVGFFDVPDRNLKGKGAPCRLTAFNRDYPELWQNALPFLKKCNRLFKELIPKYHKNQYKRAQRTPKFSIPKTAFSTVTVNYSWRTGLHQDSGDLKDGYGNLIVIEDSTNKNTYKGCCLGFPQFGIAIDCRTGDFLAMNVHEWHSNTEFIQKKKKIYEVDGKIPSKKEVKNGWHYNRMSLVLYLREKMIKCQNKENWVNKTHANKYTKNSNSLTNLKGGDNSNIDINKININNIKYLLPEEYVNYMNYKYGLFN